MISNKKNLDCPVATTISLIGNKWKLLIVRDLLGGTKRFGELRKSLTGISQRVLTENLRNLESDGLLDRRVYAEVPPRVEYSLNKTGLSLRPVIMAMAEWGQNIKTINCKIFPHRRRSGVFHPVDVCFGRHAEHPFVFAVKLAGAFIADFISGVGGIKVFRQHQALRFIKAEPFLILQRTKAGYFAEMTVK